VDQRGYHGFGERRAHARRFSSSSALATAKPSQSLLK